MNTQETKDHAERVMGWLDGDIDPGESEKLHAAFRDDPSMRQEAEALRELTRSLTNLGDYIRRHVPRIDLVDTIMEMIYDLAGVERQVILATNAPARIRRLRPFQVVRWALAAAVLIMLGLFLWQQQDVIQSDNAPLLTDNSKIAPVVETPAPGQDTIQKNNVRTITLSPPMLHENELAADEVAPPAARSREEMTFRAIADLQLAAINQDSQALIQLQQWASFSKTDLEGLLSTEGLDTNVQALLSDSLPVPQAVGALNELAATVDESAYSNFLLARKLFTFTEPPPEVWGVLQDWENSDPGNSLPQFMEASLRFYAGDADTALAILRESSQYDAASAYALSTAQYRQDAYEKLGVEADSATLLAVSRAGVEEYVFLTNLGSALMAQGENYEQAGTTETAAAIYDAVHQFGAQIVAGAAFANEALAGYDLQMDALNAYERLPNSMDNSAALAERIMDGLAALQPVFDAITRVLSADVDDGYLLEIAEQELSEGDLAIQDLLPPQ